MRKQFSEEEERRRMMEGKLYLPTGEELLADQAVCLERLYEYNHTRPSQNEEREALLKEMFAEIGEGVYLEPPFHANWAGHHVHMGKNVYANFNLTLVDDGEIYIGDYTMIGPNVTIATAGHPVLPELRQEAYQFNIPVHIGKNVWIGAGVIILPGVTVGDNTVIGAGSVVTKDIPSDVVAVGNPCRVLRPIGEKDRIYYYKDQKIDL
ncbi:MAG TPA: sugar O-acetyltransferase [Candidatus Dorea faecigallinarum]|jgi:galactoside O-acetyltransferase|nr:sugar O-acetyltransferase [Candidatus Dorea faecigallinarum]